MSGIEVPAHIARFHNSVKISEIAIYAVIKMFSAANASIAKEARDKSDEQPINKQLVVDGTGVFENICFYVTPIGPDGSEHRKHSDLLTGQRGILQLMSNEKRTTVSGRHGN